MEFNAKHTSIILKRVFDCQDPAEQIELICGEDKRRIPIHRVILNAASKYFKDLMGPNSQDDRPKEFLLDYADGETIKSVVNFCYSGNIDLTEENVEKCLMVANRAEIDLLEEKCRQFYAAKLSADNSVSILAVADTYRFVDLGDQAFELICGELETIPSEDIQNLSYQLVRELLKSDKTRDSGDVCAMRLVEWYQCNEDDRAVHMPELLKLVRLEQLTAEFLDDTLEAVYKKFKCSDILNAEYKRRALSQRVNVCVPRSRSIVYVVLQYCYGDKLSSIKIENLNNGLSIFEEAAEIPMGQCSCFGAIVYRNKIYILGGCANGSYLKSVSSYDLNSRDEGALSEMQVARQMFSTIVLGKYIYVIGGYGVGGDLNACERFDTETNKWEPVKSINAARHCAAVTVLNGYIYAAGGFADGWPSTSVELYDPNIDEWTKIAPMNKARYTFGLVESNGFLYAIGGAARAIEKFDPYKNVWTEIGSFDGCDEITNAINVDGKLFTMKLTGEYGRIDIDECGRCAFVSIAKSEYNPILKYTGVHFLCHT